jgi:hypothetical protein
MHQMTRNSTLAIAAAAGAALLGLSAAALAHDPPAGDGKQIRRVIVLDGKHAGEDGERRIEHFRRSPGEGLRECVGERTEIDEGAGDKERTRIIVCSDSKVSAEDRAKRLEETLGRIRDDEHLSAEHRARVETALQNAIARLRETR